MARSWGLFGRVCCSWLRLGCVLWRQRPPTGFRERCWKDFGAILGAKIDVFFGVCLTRRGGCFCTCLSCSFACAGALKFVLFALGAKRPPKQIHRKNHYVLMNFQCSRFCRGRREEGTRGSKREAKQHSKTQQKRRNIIFSRPRAKPPKKPTKNREKVTTGRPK